MFRITKVPSSGSDDLYVDAHTHIHTHTPQVQNMPPNTYHAHDKYLWNITSNFNQSTDHHSL